MAKVLFVVHRYVPYPGGSEYYVRDMAEEMLQRKHDVYVLAHEHQGNRNGVKLTNDYNWALNQKWDLIVVHGGDCISQNVVHQHAYQINKVSPVAYMLIKPSMSPICMNGLKHHKYITYSTQTDIDFIKHADLDMTNRPRRIRHGIVPERSIGQKQKRDKITFVSAGGFYPHKAMRPLADVFNKLGNPRFRLEIYGYGEGDIPEDTDFVRNYFGLEKEKVMDAIASADAYIMNSYEEGFGLVLLEAMMNKIPWLSRNVGAAWDMRDYGTIYTDESELLTMLQNWDNLKRPSVDSAYDYVMANHTIHQTCDDIEDIINER